MKNNFKTIKKYNQNNKSDSFVGLRITNEEIEFVFPYKYEIPTKELQLKKEMLNLIKLIDRYKTEKNINDKKFQNNFFPFNSYLWIIENYIKNGYYEEQEYKYQNGIKGKINWKKTIKNNKIYFNNEEIVYKELITKQVNHNINSIITKIHMFCVQEATKVMGWYYGVNEISVPKLNMQENQMIEILKSEIKKTFLDSKKELLLNMIKIIEGVDISCYNTKRFEITTSEFEYIFERLVEERFGTEDIKKYYPTATWHVQKVQKETRPLRPDSILKDKDNNIYILDAKYYNYGYSKQIKDLPDTYSINKQITYAENVKENKQDIKDVFNIFILPYKAEEKDEYLKYEGYATASWKNEKELETGSYSKVHVILVDLKKLINNTYGTKQQNIEKLINVLEEFKF